MPDYLYYKRGEEWVRVNADTYSQEYVSDPTYFPGGKCEGKDDWYSGSWNWEFIQSDAGRLFWRSVGYRFEKVLAPIDIEIDTASVRPRARLTYFLLDSDGEKVNSASSWKFFNFAREFSRGGDGRPRSIYFCRGVTSSNSFVGQDAVIRTYPIYGTFSRDSEDMSKSYPLTDAPPDNCGSNSSPGDCQTIFKLNGATVLILPDCPDVTKNTGCSECCRELLPMLRDISV